MVDEDQLRGVNRAYNRNHSFISFEEPQEELAGEVFIDDVMRPEEIETLVVPRSIFIDCIERLRPSAKKSKIHAIADKLIDSSLA